MEPSTSSSFSRDPHLQERLRQLYRDEPLYAPHASLCFQNLALLGEGGMGSVYRVRDSRLGRDAALKVLKRPDPRSEQRFLREARIMGRLNHPGIPPLHEAGRMASGELYMLMRIIEGGTLEEHIRAYHADGRRPQDLRALIAALVKVCEALAHAHSQGIIHRDLKPENIMIGRFGEVLLMDWGIAKDLSESEDPTEILEAWSPEETPPEEEGLTIAGTIMGTPGYMAPEQANGEVADELSDVFALGAILYELLTDRRPFHGTSLMDSLCKTVKGRFKAPRELVKSAPPELAALASIALETTRRKRPRSVLAFARDLSAYLAGEELSAYRYSASERGRRLLARYPLVLLAITTISLLALSAGFFAWRAAEARSEEASAQAARERAEASERRLTGALEAFAEARDLVRRQAATQELRATLERALELGGASYPALLEVGAIYERGRELALARAAFERAATTRPPGYEALLRLHLLDTEAYGRKRYVTRWIERMARLAEEEDSSEEFPLFARAYVALAEGRADEALALVERIERAAPRSYWAALERGIIFLKRGALNKALASLDRAIEVAPSGANSYLAYGSRGLVRAQLGDGQGAFADYDRALESNPRYALAYSNRGLLSIQLGRHERALEDFDKALRHNPRFAAIFVNRAKAHLKLGALDEALKDCERAAELEPDNAIVHFQRGCVRAERRELEQAAADFARAKTIEPEDEKTRLMQAAIARRQSILAEAAGRALDPKAARDLVLQAEQLRRKKRPREALVLLDRARVLDPLSLIADNQRGLCFIALKEYGEALEAYKRSLSLFPLNERSYNNRSVANYQLGHIEEGIRDLETLLRLFPASSQRATYQRLADQMRARLPK